jgi:hypothetical protein
VNREEVGRGAEELGVDFDEHVATVSPRWRAGRTSSDSGDAPRSAANDRWPAEAGQRIVCEATSYRRTVILLTVVAPSLARLAPGVSSIWKRPPRLSARTIARWRSLILAVPAFAVT